MPADFPRPRLAAHVRRQVDRVTGAAMLLHPEGAVELSETADAIVALADGSRTLEEIVITLSEEFDAPADALHEDVRSCLVDLAQRGLLA